MSYILIPLWVHSVCLSKLIQLFAFGLCILFCVNYISIRKKSGKSKNRSGGSHVSITVTDSFRGCEENAYEFNVLIKKTHLRCPWEITPVTLLMLEFETYVRSNAVND